MERTVPRVGNRVRMGSDKQERGHWLESNLGRLHEDETSWSTTQTTRQSMLQKTISFLVFLLYIKNALWTVACAMAFLQLNITTN